MIIKEQIKNSVPGFIKRAYLNCRKQIETKFYRGDKVICPICESSFEMFAPFGWPKRKNARCVNCGSLERHRLIYLYLKNKTGLFNSEEKIRLLHFAPERFFYNIFSQKQNIDYIPCDLHPKMYHIGKAKIYKVDITNIAFDENSFDIIICTHVLEHIPDDKLAMKELYRVMKNRGWGIFQVPIDYSRERTYEDFTITSPKKREKAFGQYDHVRWYGQDYMDRLKSAGFKVTGDNYIKNFSSEDLLKYGLFSSELIYYCQK